MSDQDENEFFYKYMQEDAFDNKVICKGYRQDRYSVIIYPN